MSNQNEQTKLEQTVGDFQKNKANFTIDSIYSQLYSDPVRGKLPEHMFVKYFLPVFAGKVTYEQYPNFLTDWVSVAGSPTSEVDIIDRTGKVIYTVPAYYNDSILNLSQTKRGVYAIATESFLESSRAPTKAAENLAMGLNSMIPEGVDEGAFIAEKRWNEIFARYGIKPETEDTKKDVEPEANASDGFDDLLDLD
jgi:hypothetical protein